MAVKLTELKGSRAKKKTSLVLEDSNREGLRRMIDAVCCRDNIEETSDGLECNAKRDEAWCRAIGEGIEDFLRLNNSPIKVGPKEAAIMRKVAETLKKNENLFKKGGKDRSISSSDFLAMLNKLRPIDNLWELCSDKIDFSGYNLDRTEMVALVAWLKTCRGGFVLNGLNGEY